MANTSNSLSFPVLLESRAVRWWAQETSGSPGALSSHRWILSPLPCSHHSTGSSSPRSESICWGCRSGEPRNFQLQPLPGCRYPWPPRESVQCQRILKKRKTESAESYIILICITSFIVIKSSKWFSHYKFMPTCVTYMYRYFIIHGICWHHVS